MAVTEGFKDFVTELLGGFGPVTIRNMLGGAGVYADGVMFAIMLDDVLYLKTDEVSQAAFESEGMGPFTYIGPPANDPSLCPIGRSRRVSSTSRRSLPHGRARRIASAA